MDPKPFLNKRVIIVKQNGSRYSGILNGIRVDQKRFHLTKMWILFKKEENSSIDAVKVASKHDTKRWFYFDTIKEIKIDPDWKGGEYHESKPEV